MSEGMVCLVWGWGADGSVIICIIFFILMIRLRIGLRWVWFGVFLIVAADFEKDGGS